MIVETVEAAPKIVTEQVESKQTKQDEVYRKDAAKMVQFIE